MAVQKTKIDFMKAVNNVGKPVATVAGFALGKYALKKLSKNHTVKGLMGTEMKDYVVPAAVTMGGLIGTQFTKNQYFQLGLVGAAGAGIEEIVKKSTGKTILQGLEGIVGDVDEEDAAELMALNPVTQSLPAADIDIEKEIQQYVSGAAPVNISDEPVGTTADDYSMSDEPVGTTADDYSMSDEPVGSTESGKKSVTEPDSMDYDIFSGDMMEA